MTGNDDQQKKTSGHLTHRRRTTPMTNEHPPSPGDPTAPPEHPRPRREEFFIHPDILRGTATYRTVSQKPRPAPSEDTDTSPDSRH